MKKECSPAKGDMLMKVLKETVAGKAVVEKKKAGTPKKRRTRSGGTRPKGSEGKVIY